MAAKAADGLAAGLAKVDAWLSEIIARGELAGAAVLCVRGGEVVHRAELGLKDIAAGAPLAPDTIYRIYSMTKPVTAAVMMALHEQGLWSPDDPIARHLPEFADVKGPDGAPVDHAPTMRELMTHTAGFGYGIGLGPHDATDKAYIDARIWKADDLADFARRVAAIPLAYQPGSAWRYSLSMDLQGAVIERVTGRPLAEVMRDTLFAPLGMVDTGFHLPPEKLPRLATLYYKGGGDRLAVLDSKMWVDDPKVAPKLPKAGGGLFSTLDDYGRFARMLLNKGELDGARVLQPQSVELMTRNHLSQAILDRGEGVGFQKIGPGRGFGFNGAVFFDPVAAKHPVGAGAYQWDGASAVWFWVDWANDLCFVGMVQRMMDPSTPALQAITQRIIGEALAAG